MPSESKTVSFTRMEDATSDELAIVMAEAKVHLELQVADRVLALLASMKGPTLGYQIDRYDHSLQTATRAMRDGARTDMIVAAGGGAFGSAHVGIFRAFRERGVVFDIFVGTSVGSPGGGGTE